MIPDEKDRYIPYIHNDFPHLPPVQCPVVFCHYDDITTIIHQTYEDVIKIAKEKDDFVTFVDIFWTIANSFISVYSARAELPPERIKTDLRQAVIRNALRLEGMQGLRLDELARKINLNNKDKLDVGLMEMIACHINQWLFLLNIKNDTRSREEWLKRPRRDRFEFMFTNIDDQPKPGRKPVYYRSINDMIHKRNPITNIDDTLKD